MMLDENSQGLPRMVRWIVVGAGLAVAGCGNSVGGEPYTPPDVNGTTGEPATTNEQTTGNNTTGQTGTDNNGTTGNTDNTGQNTGGTNPDVPCAKAATDAQTVLTEYCSSCHANGATLGGFGTILDVQAMIGSGKVVPGDADASPIYARMSTNTMPPQSTQKRPSAEDIQTIANWIGECDALDPSAPDAQPLEFVNIDTRLRAMLDDLRSFPNPTDRERMRYLDLTVLANAGFSQQQIQTYREAVSFLVNSLSLGQRVIPPEAIDEAELLYRIDLRDYVWDADTWRLLEAEYPYAVIYDQDSRLFPYDETTAEQIRLETGTDIPYIQADWFLSHAARPPLYHDILQLPDTLQGLEQQLGIDIDANIAAEDVLRAGFQQAGPSKNYRLIERHEIGGNQGAFWISYDFASNVAGQNLFANPLDFQEDGGEVIFNLQNGLQAYLVTAADGTRLDKAPTNVVQDPRSRDGAVENGLSCLTCHQIDGMLPKYDEIRDNIQTSALNQAELEAVLAIYADRETLQAAFERDQNRYRSARSSLGIENISDTTFHTVNDTHLDVLNLNMVAAVLGVTTDQLSRALDASPQVFPPEIVSLRTQGGGVQRDALEAVIDDLILALGLGEPLRASIGSDVESSF